MAPRQVSYAREAVLPHLLEPGPINVFLGLISLTCRGGGMIPTVPLSKGGLREEKDDELYK